MDDLEFRRRSYVNPHDKSAEFMERRTEDPASDRFAREMIAFDQKLHNALNVPVPENLANRILLNQSLAAEATPPRQWLKPTLALAASVFLGIAITLEFLLPRDQPNHNQLVSQLVAHAQESLHDDHHLSTPTSMEEVNTLLTRYGGRTTGDIGPITYAGHCPIGDKIGLHLIVPGERGYVTIIYLPDTGQIDFELDGKPFDGRIIPATRGTFALIGEPGESLDLVEKRIIRKFYWSV